MIRPVLACALALGLVACDDPDAALRDTRFARRQTAALVDACALSPDVYATLAGPARGAVSEVILLCAAVRDRAGAAVAPEDPAARATLKDALGTLRALGYRATLGLGASDDIDGELAPDRLGALLADPAQRAAIVAGARALAEDADGLALLLPTLPEGARGDLSALATGLSGALHPARRLAVALPPSSMRPSDLPGGEAYDVPALAKVADALPLLTLDLHCGACADGRGPTTDAGWITDVVGLARELAPGGKLLFSAPLYGADLGPVGDRPLRYAEALGLAATQHRQIARDAGGSLTFRYDGADGPHEVWFEDALATPALLSDVDARLGTGDGLLLWGLGSEDPGLWAALRKGAQ